MASETCDGCGEQVAIAGGIASIWRSTQEPTGGMHLDLADGTEHFLCHACIDRLPEDRNVVAADVEALSEE